MDEKKFPSYNFACAIDDMLNDISFVIRKKEHLVNTPLQIYIRDLLGYKKDIIYAHIPNIKSSKQNPLSIKHLLNEGYLPLAIINYLLLVGYKTDKDFFSLKDAILWYDISKISKSSLSFDIKKLKELNKRHIQNSDSLKLSSFLGFKSKQIGDLAKLYAQELSSINEIKEKIDKIFSQKNCEDKECEKLKEEILKAPFFEDFDNFANYLINKTSLEERVFFKYLRYLLTGVKKGPKLSDIYPHIKNYIKEITR